MTLKVGTAIWLSIYSYSILSKAYITLLLRPPPYPCTQKHAFGGNPHPPPKAYVLSGCPPGRSDLLLVEPDKHVDITDEMRATSHGIGLADQVAVKVCVLVRKENGRIIAYFWQFLLLFCKISTLSVFKLAHHYFSRCANLSTARIIVRAKRSNLKILLIGTKQHDKWLKNIQLNGW